MGDDAFDDLDRPRVDIDFDHRPMRSGGIRMSFGLKARAGFHRKQIKFRLLIGAFDELQSFLKIELMPRTGEVTSIPTSFTRLMPQRRGDLLSELISNSPCRRCHGVARRHRRAAGKSAEALVD